MIFVPFCGFKASHSCHFTFIEPTGKGTLIMKSVCRIIAVVVVTVAAALSANSQEAPKPQSAQPQSTPQGTQSQTTQPAATDDQASAQDYVFPTRRERFDRYVSSTVGPFRLMQTTVSAGLEQWKDSPEEWGQGMKGYGKRFASSLGRNAIQQTVTYGLDQTFELDTGFRKSTREGFLPRFKDALVQNVTSRTKSGKRVISVPRFAGVYTGSVIATETWYPERSSYKDGLRQGTATLLTGFGINLLREFVFNW